MRCLALADFLRKLGARCVFAGTQETLSTVPALARSCHDWIGLPSPGDALALTDAVLRNSYGDVDCLVVDHYGWGAVQETVCRVWANKILVIDDLADRKHDCDLLLDQTFGRDAADYAGLVPSHCKKIVGARYALLREEFTMARPAALKRRSSGTLGRVLISMGLTDAVNASALVLSGIVLSGLSLQIDVVLGESAPHLPSIRSLIRSLGDRANDKVKLHVGTEAISELMTSADMAFGAAGTSSWERCCLGLPTVLISVAPNQEKIASELANANAAISLGQFCKISGASVADIISSLNSMPRRLIEIANSAANVCDGRGVHRISELLR